jgi:hypothetical protein
MVTHVFPMSCSGEQYAKFGFAKTSRILQHRVEDRLQFSRRTTDNLEHVGGCDGSRAFSIAITAWFAKSVVASQRGK